MEIYNYVLILLWGAIIPFVIGCLWTRKNDLYEDSLAMAIVMGFITMLAVFQLLAVPMIVFKSSFHLLAGVWIAVMVVLVVVSFIMNSKRFIRIMQVAWKRVFVQNMFTRVLILAGIILVLFQMWMLAGHMHVDTDDSRYMAESMEAYEIDTMIQYHPITGEHIDVPNGEMIKDIVAPFSFYITLLAKLLLLHPLAVAHIVIPLLFIPYAYFIYYLIARRLLGDKLQEVAIFMFFINLLICFAYGSLYSLSFYFLLRIWQGKAMFISVMLPAILLSSLNIVQEKGRGKQYWILFCVMLASSIGSGMASILPPLIVGATILMAAIKEKKIRPLIYGGICIVPNMVFAVVYILINRGYLM